MQIPAKLKDKKVLAFIGFSILLILTVCCAVSIISIKIIKDREDKSETNEETESTTDSNDDTEDKDNDEDKDDQEDKDDDTDDDKDDNTTTSDVVIPDNRNIVFVRRGEDSDMTDDTLWIADWDGDNARSLGITNVVEAINGTNHEWILYTSYSDRYSIFLYNIVTEETKTISIPELPDATPTIGQENNFTISPNGEIFTYSISYVSETCFDICPVIDPYPASKTGHYAYHLDTDITVYLGNFLLVANWDSSSENIYTLHGADYHGYNLSDGAYKINVTNGTATKMDDNESFGDSFYYLEDQNIKIKFTGETDTGGQMDVIKDGITTTIDSGDWAYLQPFIDLSPSKNRLVYIQRTGGVNSPYRRIMLNLNTLATTPVLEPGVDEQFGNLNYWVNDSYFVTQSTIGDWVTGDKDLVLVNVTTGERTMITDFGDVDFK